MPMACAAQHTAATVAGSALELVVVGAGPAGLAVVSRLARDACKGCSSTAVQRERWRTLLEGTRVVDPAGGWLDEWRRKLGSQGVTQLRSPTFVHPHPSRVVDDALLAFARAQRRTAELAPLPCGDGWAAPSAALFEDFCASVARDFCGGPLESCLVRGRVVDVRPLSGGGFELDLEGGARLRSARVVLALGDGGVLRVPSWLPEGRHAPVLPSPVVLHASHLGAASSCDGAWVRPRSAAQRAAWWLVCAMAARPRWLPLLRRLVRCATAGGRAGAASLAWPRGRGRLVVVGGGLSGAQLAIHALRLGWAHVSLLLRDEVQVRPFDIDAEWMARHHKLDFSPLEQQFYRAAPPRRRELLRAARPGGSLTPGCLAQLGELQRRGGLRVLQRASVGEAVIDGDGCWELRLRGAAGEASTAALHADALWLATGHELDASRVALLQRVLHQSPRPLHGGLPELTPSLRWAEGSELFLAGPYAALQVGPDAFNLAGCAAAAARIAAAILDGVIAQEAST